MRHHRLKFTLIAAVLLLASACGGGGGGGAGNPGRVQFETGNFTVDEDAGTASITITRVGGSDGAVNVAVTSSDGSAVAGQDYTALSTTVSFAAGDSVAKTVTVPILDDGAGEGDETVALALSAPTGGAGLGASATAALTIRDNDPLTAPAKPTLDVTADIKQLRFNWASVEGATSYRLLVNPDGASAFTQVGAGLAGDADSTTLEVAVHRHDWINALYRLDACNGNRCTASDPISTAQLMLDAIGYFKASNTEAAGQSLGDQFGFSIALSADGNTLAVGAITEDSRASGVDGNQNDNNAENAGAVYVFTRNGALWSQQAYLKASNTDGDGEFFGGSVALSADGNILAVGAQRENSGATGVDSPGAQNDDGAANAGAVYVFTRVGVVWSQQAYIKASNTQAGDVFGTSLALSADGSTLAVGAPLEGSEATGVNGNQSGTGAANAGAVYVFTRTNLIWSQQAYVKASNSGQNDNFGTSLALSDDGNTLAVGAIGEGSSATGVDGDQGNNIASLSGAVYVFTRNDTTLLWSHQAYVKASNAQAGDLFGQSVALSADGNTLAVGARREDSNAIGVDGDQSNNDTNDAGAAYVFTRSGVVWSQQAYIKASNPGIVDQFGGSLALSDDGNELAVGAKFEDGNALGVGGDQNDGAQDAGAVYVFERVGAQWSQHAYVKASNGEAEDEFGFSLALSGDGNTLAVSAVREDSNATGVGGEQADDSTSSAGAVFVY